MQTISGLAEIAHRYQGFIVDQFGVLHDGQAAYPGAVDCLKKLSQAGKKIVMLTNSGKSAAANIERVQTMGFDRFLFRSVVTSGEAAKSALTERTGSFFSQLGKRGFMIGSARDYPILDEAIYQLVETVEQADFILFAGLESSHDESYYKRIIDYGIDNDLPLICANPDQRRITDSGIQKSCGAYASEYQSFGGRVTYFGKPYPDIYETCKKHLADCAPEKILAVGDSFHHDVAGAAGVSLPSLFISDGVHKEEFANLKTDLEKTQRAKEIVKSENVMPEWVIKSFHW